MLESRAQAEARILAFLAWCREEQIDTGDVNDNDVDDYLDASEGWTHGG